MMINFYFLFYLYQGISCANLVENYPAILSVLVLTDTSKSENNKRILSALFLSEMLITCADLQNNSYESVL